MQKDCGEKPFQNRLKEKSHLGSYYQSEDSLVLAKAADMLADKIQIIGMNIINQKKFKTTASHQLYELESKVDKFITLEFFRKEHEDLQRKI